MKQFLGVLSVYNTVVSATLVVIIVSFLVCVRSFNFEDTHLIDAVTNSNVLATTHMCCVTVSIPTLINIIMDHFEHRSSFCDFIPILNSVLPSLVFVIVPDRHLMVIQCRTTNFAHP